MLSLPENLATAQSLGKNPLRVLCGKADHRQIQEDAAAISDQSLTVTCEVHEKSRFQWSMFKVFKGLLRCSYNRLTFVGREKFAPDGKKN